MKVKRASKSQKRNINGVRSLSTFVKGICDVMRRSNCASALQYVPELTWILFLRLLDAQEARDQEEADAVGVEFTHALRAPYRWQDWAAPWSDKAGHPKTPEGKPFGWKRQELFAAGVVAPKSPDISHGAAWAAMNSRGERYPSARCG